MNLSALTLKKLDSSDVGSFKSLTDLFVEVFEEPRLPLSENELAGMLTNPMFHAFVAESDNAVVGGCTIYELPRYYAEKPEWFIYDVAVKESHQKKGIGKQLIRFVKDSARENDVGSLFVLAHSDDEQAVKFYRAVHGKAERVDLFEFDV